MNNYSNVVFIDANVLVYFLDQSASQHKSVVAILQKLIDAGASLFTSHHVIEEVLFIVSRLSGNKDALSTAVKDIAAIPSLNLVEPAADFNFAKAYVELYKSSKVGINDTLLLQLILDAGITVVFSYDQKFLKQANKLGIKEPTPTKTD